MRRRPAGRRADVACRGRHAAAAVLLSDLPEEGFKGGGVGPVQGDAGVRLPDDPRHGTVRLADSQDGTPGRQVLEEFAGKDGAVLGVVPEGKQEDGCGALFPYRARVGAIAERYNIVFETVILH